MYVEYCLLETVMPIGVHVVLPGVDYYLLDIAVAIAVEAVSRIS